MKTALLAVALIASLGGFFVHLATAVWLPHWLASQMQGVIIQPSWDVRYLAAATSIEYGIAAVVIYCFARPTLVSLPRWQAVAILFIVFAGIHGAILRQPLMDYAVGNPLQVVIVQNAAKWSTWLVTAIITVLGVDHAYSRFGTTQ